MELNRAQANLELAHRALDLYLNSAESWFPRDPGSDLEDSALLKTALTFYEQIASQNSAPEVEVRTFSAYIRVGDIRAALGDIRDAEDAYRKAMRIMVERAPARPRRRRQPVLAGRGPGEVREPAREAIDLRPGRVDLRRVCSPLRAGGRSGVPTIRGRSLRWHVP